MELKIGDVYTFGWNAEWTAKKHDPYHCFDGQLTVMEGRNGLLLADSYWASDNKCFTLEEALSKGTLTFKCNLDEVEKIEEHELKYYHNADVFNLSRQHGCYRIFAKKKGAQRSTEKMKQALLSKKEDLEYTIKFATRDLERIEENLQKLEQNNTDFSI